MADIVDSYSESNQDEVTSIFAVHPSSGTGHSAKGQTFTGNEQNLYSCKFYLKKYTGSPGNLIARLYAHTGTWGSTGIPTGSPLDSSNLIAASGLSGTLTLVEFTGFSGYTLVNGTKYCIVLEAYNGTWDLSNYIHVGEDITSPTHGGNFIYYSSSAWLGIGLYDICFYVYGITPVTFQPFRSYYPHILAH
jgi:hypothetical protein